MIFTSFVKNKKNHQQQQRPSDYDSNKIEVTLWWCSHKTYSFSGELFSEDGLIDSHVKIQSQGLNFCLTLSQRPLVRSEVLR